MACLILQNPFDDEGRRSHDHAALLLKQQGYEVIGLFMKNWDETDENGNCPADADYQDVIRVCEKLDIPYYSVNFVQEYWDSVFQEFLSDYRKGFTPNPDVLCNREIKFKVFMEYARMLGGDLIATGHYVRRADREGRTYLLKGLDANKDQSYFLHAVGENEFAHSLFPVGELEKPEVRRIAADSASSGEWPSAALACHGVDAHFDCLRGRSMVD